METLIFLIFFTPLLFLVFVLVRHARRIHRDAIDKGHRTERLDNLDRSIADAVLERDDHTCQSCGTTAQVGVDFRGSTPPEGHVITADELEARCTRCYLNQWRTLRGDPESDGDGAGPLPRIW